MISHGITSTNTNNILTMEVRKMDVVNRILKERGGFIVSPNEINEIIELDRLHPILVRCGSGRFSCPAQDVNHFVDIINNSNKDYVRDVSVQRRQ
jgi:hypothetical protein